MKLFGFEIKIPGIRLAERRQAERVRIWTDNALDLDYQIPGEVTEEGEGRDISTRGIRFASPSSLAKGTPVDLTLRFSSNYAPNKVLHIKAYVVRAYRYPRQKRPDRLRL